jgi:hypothetical protein
MPIKANPDRKTGEQARIDPGTNPALSIQKSDSRRRRVHEYTDEEFEAMSDEEIETVLKESFLNMICSLSLIHTLKDSRTGENAPNREAGESYLKDYENTRSILLELLKPEYHEMLNRVHAEAYREEAGCILAAALEWEMSGDENDAE